jgi:thiamine-phosphate diphosphorylase
MRRTLRSPIICLVTDRRRVRGQNLDTLVALAQSAAAAGVHLISIREPDLETGRLFDLTRRMLDATAGTGTAVIVNERIDVAIAARAHGVHLRADSVGARRVRAIAPVGFLVGQAVHSAAEAVAAAAADADFVVMGTIYPSRSKPGLTAFAGLTGLAEVCRAVRLPVLAIGGVTADRAAEVAGAGASGIAAIGLFSDAFARTSGVDGRARLARLVQTMTDAFASS